MTDSVFVILNRYWIIDGYDSVYENDCIVGDSVFLTKEDAVCYINDLSKDAKFVKKLMVNNKEFFVHGTKFSIEPEEDVINDDDFYGDSDSNWYHIKKLEIKK